VHPSEVWTPHLGRFNAEPKGRKIVAHGVSRAATPATTRGKRLSAGICKRGPFYATFFTLLTAMNSTLVTACRLAFSSR
jgi:hypothetical protein